MKTDDLWCSTTTKDVFEALFDASRFGPLGFACVSLNETTMTPLDQSSTEGLPLLQRQIVSHASKGMPKYSNTHLYRFQGTESSIRCQLRFKQELMFYQP